MQIFKTIYFHKWAKHERLSDSKLRASVEEIENGLFDANLGGSVYKKRIPVGSRGKSGGLRTIVAFQDENNSFFLYGYAKNARDNISTKEKAAFKLLAKKYLGLNSKELKKLIKIRELLEVL